jgi:hypothetical protein
VHECGVLMCCDANAMTTADEAGCVTVCIVPLLQFHEVVLLLTEARQMATLKHVSFDQFSHPVKSAQCQASCEDALVRVSALRPCLFLRFSS